MNQVVLDCCWPGLNPTVLVLFQAIRVYYLIQSAPLLSVLSWQSEQWYLFLIYCDVSEAVLTNQRLCLPIRGCVPDISPVLFIRVWILCLPRYLNTNLLFIFIVSNCFTVIIPGIIEHVHVHRHSCRRWRAGVKFYFTTRSNYLVPNLIPQRAAMFTIHNKTIFVLNSTSLAVARHFSSTCL